MITASDPIPDSFDGDAWMAATLPPLKPGDMSLMSSVLGNILVRENFNLEQIHIIEEYWENATKDEIILTTAFRAGMYSAAYTHEEILLHACKFVAYSLGDDESEEKPLAMNWILQELEWLLAAEVISKEIYCRVVMKTFSENLDFETLIYMIAREVGLLDESIFLNLNVKGENVNCRLENLYWYCNTLENENDVNVKAEGKGGESVGGVNGEYTFDVTTLDEEQCETNSSNSLNLKHDDVLSSSKLNEFALGLLARENNRGAIESVWEMMMGLTAFAFGGKSNEAKGKNRRRSCTCSSRNVRYQKNTFPDRAIYSLLIFLAASSKCFVAGTAGFVWTYYQFNHYDQLCKVPSSEKSTHSCNCIHSGTVIKPGYGEAGHDGWSFFASNYEDEKAKKVTGDCGQCAGGSFFGHMDSSSSSKITTTTCDGNKAVGGQCSCSIVTYAKGSLTMAHNLFYVCSHHADNSDPVKNAPYTSVCVKCPAGTYSNQGDMVCSVCEKGKYSDTGSSTCQPCPLGTYSDKSGTTECSPCPPGHINNTTEGSSSKDVCKKCTAGTYASSDGSECLSCGYGEYSDEGASECIAAAPGSYVGATNTAGSLHTAQYPCPIGSHAENPEGGSGKCVSCETGKSTYDTNSSSSDACIECVYGVNPHTFACANEEVEENLNNLCWDAGQLLGMNASSAVQDLYNLVYEIPNVGLNDMINNTMSFIQKVANGEESFKSIQASISSLLNGLKNADQNWLTGVSGSYQDCMSRVTGEINYKLNDSNDDTNYNTNLFQYQFGDSSVEKRSKWIAHWKCTGATFGCVNSEDTPCTVATNCFEPIYQSFAALLTGPGGASFGNFPISNIGRYTPEYSVSYFQESLLSNVQSLVSWENTVDTLSRYEDVMDKIQQMGDDIKSEINQAEVASYQIRNVSMAANLQTSLTNGDLFYAQVEQNYDKTIELAQIVQWGPAYCPKGSKITAKGLGNCTDIDTLVKKCKEEIIGKLVSKLTMGLAKAIAGGRRRRLAPIAAWTKLVNELSTNFAKIGQLMTTSQELLNGTACSETLKYDPKTQLPQYPNGADVSTECMDALYKWYIHGQEGLSKFLVVWSPAEWDSIYLANYEKIEPTILHPPNCHEKKKIVSALTDYLANVKSMTNFGNAMTTAALSLAPQMGNIASYLATLGAIQTATQAIENPPSTINQAIVTAPPDWYQGIYNKLFYSTYSNTSKAIVAYLPATSLALQQYTAAETIFNFCASYSYMNAGRAYTGYKDHQGDCSTFGTYLPTSETFQATVSSFAMGYDWTQPPQSVSALNNNIIDFAQGLANDPNIQGTTRTAEELKVQSYSIEIPFDGNGYPTIPQVYGDLNSTGSIRFSVTPSSDIMFQNHNSFGVLYENPQVVNVQVFLRGVYYSSIGNEASYIRFIVNPNNPFMIYDEQTGVGTPYHLPPFTSEDQNEVFAIFDSLQATNNTCATEQTNQPTKWMNGESPMFCTPYTTDFKLPQPNLDENAFLFPALYSTWTITLVNFNPVSSYYVVNRTELALQVMYQYAESDTSNPRSQGSKTCAARCQVNTAAGSGTAQNPTPLLYKQWCDREDCETCVASYVPYDDPNLLGDQFCRCNVWNGEFDMCTITTPESMSITTTSRSSENTSNIEAKGKGGKDYKVSQAQIEAEPVAVVGAKGVKSSQAAEAKAAKRHRKREHKND